MRPLRTRDVVRRLGEHAMAVRRMDPHLRMAHALLVAENNHGDDAGMAELLEQLAELPDDMLKPYTPLHVEAAIASETGSRKRKRPVGLNAAFLTGMPGDVEGRVRPWANTGANNKPSMVLLLKNAVEENRIYWHKNLVAAVGSDEEQRQAYEELMMDDGELEVLQLLHLVEPHTGERQRTQRFEAAFVAHERETARKMAYDQLRGFRYRNEVRLRPDGSQYSHREWTGKKSDGPHKKQDDLVMSLAQLLFSVKCVSGLQGFMGVRTMLNLT